MSKLKYIRIALSTIFFLSILTLFVDIKDVIPASVYNGILFFQFIPSILKFVNTFTLISTGFIFVIILTFLFGRVYCASFCPLGILQDIIIFFKRRFKRKVKFRYSKENKILRYSILIIAIIGLLTSTTFILNLLDPYSNAGRIFTSFVKPVFIGGNNLISFTLQSFNNYSIFPVEFKGVGVSAFIFSTFVMISILVLTIWRGRIYCNSICPVGTFLGLISKFSIFKIQIDKNNCKSCGVCEKICRAECISKHEQEIDHSRCVSCFDCLKVCPTKGISISNNNLEKLNSKKEIQIKQVEEEKFINSKRTFLISTVVYFAAISNLNFAQVKIQNKKPTKIPNNKKFPVAPPGAKSISHLKENCTACNLCVSACPTSVLQPSYLEFGFTGMMVPRMDYHKSFCNFDCKKCTEICPTGALETLNLPDKKLTQLGKAIFIKDNCIVHTEKTDCGACSEHCPTKAVIMVPYEKRFLPEMHTEFCIGCGACEFACPVKPHKAIFVDGNFNHAVAKKPEVKKLDEKVDYKEEFPF